MYSATHQQPLILLSLLAHQLLGGASLLLSLTELNLELPLPSILLVDLRHLPGQHMHAHTA